jgi:CBS domain-containing protein
MSATNAPTSPSPASSLIAQLANELRAYAPFAQMEMAHVLSFVAACQQRYFAPDEAVLSPSDGAVKELIYVRRGAITGSQGMAQIAGGFLYEAGDVFPVSAAFSGRAVTASYKASEDSFVLALPVATMHTLAAQSPPFADFLNGRVQQFLELSRKALQDHYASRVLAEQSMETALGELAKRKPLACAPDTPLSTALAQMHRQRVGSMLITDSNEVALGILTRGDVLSKITLPAVPLSAPISEVMSTPVQTLTTQDTAQDAALLMSRHSIRHVPITQSGRVVGIVSERDLFAMQRLSLQQLSGSLRKAADVAALQQLAPDIRSFAERLLGQGVQARQLTNLVSHLNDLLTRRLLDLLCVQHGLSPAQACWLALGSEGREEQTIATDQDNALVLQDDLDEATQAKWLALAREANEALDACGYPLCAGNIMASNAELCLMRARWQERFAHWMDIGTPEDLLNASIFFDLRPLWGQAALATQLREFITDKAQNSPRFLKLLAINALQRSVPLTWTGAIDTRDDGTVDLKLRGTAIFVDAARLYALAHGVSATNTRARLSAIGPALNAPQREYEGWITGFEFLQMLRLRVQMEIASGAGNPDEPNRMEVRSMNTIDRRILKESLRMLGLLQERMRMDYAR